MFGQLLSRGTGRMLVREFAGLNTFPQNALYILSLQEFPFNRLLVKSCSTCHYYRGAKAFKPILLETNRFYGKTYRFYGKQTDFMRNKRSVLRIIPILLETNHLVWGNIPILRKPLDTAGVTWHDVYTRSNQNGGQRRRWVLLFFLQHYRNFYERTGLLLAVKERYIKVWSL